MSSFHATRLEHADADKKDDATLRREARAHLAQSGPLQVVAELLAKLRFTSLPWWSPSVLRSCWSATQRMRWLAQRPDLRQEITTGLTGLAPRAARRKDPDFQAALIDSVLDDGDIEVDRFEEAFDPCDIAVYGPAAEIWRTFRERMPWHDDAQVHQDLTAWLIRTLLAEKSSLEAMTRKPVLSPWEVRTNIDGMVWHSRMPLEVRVAIDDARFKLEREKPSQPFHARDDLVIAVPELIAANIPLEHLERVFDAAERALGFDRSETPRPSPPIPSPNEVGRGAAVPKADEAPSAQDGKGAAHAAAPTVDDARARAGAERDAEPLEDLEKTNPWAVPNVDEMWTGDGDAPWLRDLPTVPNGPPEAASKPARDKPDPVEPSRADGGGATAPKRRRK